MSHNKNTIATFVITIVASSCAVERQVYFDGQEIEWHKKMPGTLVSDDAQADKDIVDPQASQTAAIVSATSSYGSSIDREPSAPEGISETEIRNTIAPTTRGGLSALNVETKDPYSRSSDQRFIRYGPNDDSERQGNKGLVGGGWFLLVIGLMLLLFVSIIIGAILMIGGLAMIIAGSSDSSSTNREKKEEKGASGEWQDVVYLQNGSVIRGMVIEQVPNVSLKIQTADGSVFVYEMKDVLKITKEQRPK